MSCKPHILAFSWSLKSLPGAVNVLLCYFMYYMNHAWQLLIHWESYLVRCWLFFHSTLITMIINITMLLMRIRVTGTMNDHNNGLAIKPLLPWVASQQLWREKKWFQQTKKGIQTLFYAVHTTDIHLAERPAKSQYPFALYIYWRWFSRIQLTRKMKSIDSAKFLCETVWSSGKKVDF